MITNGEQEIDKVICILPDGSNGAPCGACRELMVQLMAGNYYDIEIMLDYAAIERNIHTIRKAKNLSQEQLAEKI